MAISGSASYPMPTDQYFDLASDGTLGYSYTNGFVFTALTGAQMQDMTNFNVVTNAVTAASTSMNICLVFPEPRTITAWSFAYAYDTVGRYASIQTSSDTTNGEDGSWNSVVAQASLDEHVNATAAKFRNPKTVNWTNVKGLRLVTVNSGGNMYIRELGLWGNYTPSGLQFWHATNSSPMAGDNFDIGNAARSATYSTTFRIKNNSATQTANNITITSSSTAAVGGIRNTLEFSDGGAYANSVVLTSLAPGATSNVITIRRIVNASETLNSFGTTKVTAVAQSWT